MKTVRFSYAAEFACLADACPDNCCCDWEIALDPAAMEYYRTMPGDLGEEIRSTITDDDGPCFRLRDGRCPFLNDAGLCRIQLQCGAQALTRNCDYFPRFYEEYGATRELTLSPGCPEAARLLLEAPALELTISEDGVPVTEPNMIDPELYVGLRALRDKALRICLEETRPLKKRMGQLLFFARLVQRALDADAYDRLAEVSDPLHWPSLQVQEAALVSFCLSLEIQRPDWPELLQRRPNGTPDERAASRYLVHWVYRYFLKAVNDDRLLERVRAGIYGAILIERLTAAGISAVDAIYRYTREIEHNAQNLAQLEAYDATGGIKVRSRRRH